jgi:hypothetical protein
MSTTEKEIEKQETCSTTTQSCSTEKAQAEQQTKQQEQTKPQEKSKEHGGCCGG